MKILHKLLISFFLITVIAGIFGYAIVRTNAGTFAVSLGDDAAHEVEVAATDMDRTIYERMDVFRDYASDTHVVGSVEASNHAFEKIGDVQGYVDRQDESWRAAKGGLATPLMKSILDTELSTELRRRIRYHNERHGYVVYGEIFVTNRYGANVAMTGRTTDYRQDDEDWWRLARDKGFYVGDVGFDESAGIRSIDVGIRVVDERGDFIGVMKVVLNVDSVVAGLGRAMVSHQKKRVDFMLIDSAGRNIYSTDGSPFQKDMTKEPFFAGIKGDKGFLTASGNDAGKGEKIFAYARSKGFRDYEGLGWFLIMEHDKAEVMAPLTRLTGMFAWLLTAMVVASLGVSYLLAVRLSGPLVDLRAIAKAIESGNRDISIEADTGDEIGDLARAFKGMTVKLHKAIDDRDAEIELRKRLEDEQRRLAITDRLTGLYNRTMFDEVVKKEIERAHRYGRPMAMSICDIDHFKSVNDRYGHGMGDAVLKKMADVISAHMRRTSYLFRWGGEEFVLIVTEADVEGARIQAERIREAVEATDFSEVGRVTLSFGVAGLRKEDTEDSILARADKALYMAKDGGRNRVEIGV